MRAEVSRGVALLKAGRLAEAEGLLRAALAADGGDATALEMLGRCLLGQRQLAEAEECFAAWAGLRGGESGPWAHLAAARHARGDRAGAQRAALSALEVPRPTAEDFRSALETLLEVDDFATAARFAQGAVRAAPGDPDFRVKLVAALAHLGACEDAGGVAQASLPLAAGRPDLAVSVASLLLYGRDDPAPLAAAHAWAGKVIEAGAGPALPAADWLRRDPLRVALVSPDLRRHSVAFFLEPLLRHHERTGLELLAVSTTLAPDATTERLRGLLPPGRWHEHPAREPAALAAALRALRCDVLIECAGYTSPVLLAAFAARPARVQWSYCGYPHATGLAAITARMADGVTDPLPSAGGGEGVVVIDAPFLAFAAPEAPPIGWSPPSAQRPLTFASFNAPMKLSERVLRLWAGVLAGAPASRLLLKVRGGEWPATAAAHRKRLAAAGVPAERVEIVGLLEGHDAHLALYDRVDIALDTLPYHGTTTTCEALLMGVPVVTAAGVGHHARVGASLLNAVGAPELVADDDAGYVRIAAELAADAARLAAYRRSLRGRLLASPLCDGAGLAVRFGEAVRRGVAAGAPAGAG